ncbi:OmpA family protein [Ectothiorhodospira lacustris]|uniref:OmpA family protein n=1 Tax=Ectothiorhodospira lacustris TaxID=2899127 RepID=UPI001EE8284C|nr:OmpA family protein [Ectothiorhodospira lacustris]MCG5502092.1 OmpA family protein [Ectothiorhodospira lacustris]
MTVPPGADSARAKLMQLQADPQLAGRAPVELRDAELAVRAAEKPQADGELARHQVLIADRKVDIAKAWAQTRLLEDQRAALSDQGATARLDSRTREVDQARRETAELQRQIEAMNAKPTDRGLVLTLGDVLFATGRSELRGGAVRNLDQLAVFLREHPERTAIIEGHTDSVGSASANMRLSEQRADSVKRYLVRQGVDANRLHAAGRGQDYPVAENNTASGRQQNRRVEIIIPDAAGRER